jgi:hypothetical protein
MHEFRAKRDALVGREQISPSTTNRGRRGRFTCFNIVDGLKLAPLGLAGISRVTGAGEDGGDWRRFVFFLRESEVYLLFFQVFIIRTIFNNKPSKRWRAFSHWRPICLSNRACTCIVG